PRVKPKVRNAPRPCSCPSLSSIQGRTRRRRRYAGVRQASVHQARTPLRLQAHLRVRMSSRVSRGEVEGQLSRRAGDETPDNPTPKSLGHARRHAQDGDAMNDQPRRPSSYAKYSVEELLRKRESHHGMIASIERELARRVAEASARIAGKESE